MVSGTLTVQTPLALVTPATPATWTLSPSCNVVGEDNRSWISPVSVPTIPVTAHEGWPIGEAWKRRTALIPLGRPETADDVAGVVTFLASRDADYMTGQAVIADGGLVMGS